MTGSTGSSPLQRRILTAFGVPFVFSLLISVAMVVYLVDSLLSRQMQAKITSDLRSAREIYNIRIERLTDLVRFGANLDSVRRAMKRGDLDELKAALQPLRVRRGEDILSMADAAGRVVLRSRNPEMKGDSVAHLAPVKAALIGETVGSTEILSIKDLGLEGEDLAERARIPLYQTPRANPTSERELQAGMVIFASSPVIDEMGNIIGVLYAGHLLNRDFSFVDKIRTTVFADQTVEGLSVGTATIFLGDVRVTTNVPAEGGQRALGTRVSSEVAERVLKSGASWIDRAYVVTDWYLAAYEPILNSREAVVGILYVGILEKPYHDLVVRSILTVGFLQLAGLTLVFFLLNLVVSRMVVRPLRRLSTGALRIGSGDLNHLIPVESKDEIGQLAGDFNAMTDNLRKRDQAIEKLRVELEDKVVERSSALEKRNQELTEARSEVLVMMEKQKDTNRELQSSLERLKETQEELVRSGKLAALGAMAAGVAHEINTPLATIRGNLEILALKLKGQSEFVEELSRIEQQADRMQGIVQNLLTFARADKGLREPTDIRRAVVDVLTNQAVRASEKHIEIETDLPDYIPPVMANFEKLVQVFTNLVKNAFQAMPQGGQLTVSARLGQEMGEVLVSFTDTGIGIPAQDIPKVWNPFFTTKPSGTGLGLSISHALIEEFGGKITLASEPGRGATFTVHLRRAL